MGECVWGNVWGGVCEHDCLCSVLRRILTLYFCCNWPLALAMCVWGSVCGGMCVGECVGGSV